MLVSEATFAAGARKLAYGMQVKRPPRLSVFLDSVWIRYKLMPSYLESLQEVEEVQLCAGFDLDRAFDIYIGGAD